MLRYVIKRILFLIPVIICVSFIVFALMELVPGTVVDSMISSEMSEEDVAALMAQYDLDKPMIYRYGKYMFRLVQGDLGISDTNKLNVWDQYISRLPNTLLLSFTALIIGAVVAIPMGIRAARHAGTLVDNATTTFTLIGMSMPGFWVGLLLLLIFSHILGWLPAGGDRHGVRSIILPAICSGLVLMASATRQTRSSMLEVLNSDYLRTARAKGVPEEKVIREHALGNAWIPILTAIGGSLSVSLAGSVVVESVFAWPGVGRMAAEAVLARDVTMTCGCVIMTSILYVLVQLIVDLLYALVDPRIKSQYASAHKKKRYVPAGAGAGGQPDAEQKSRGDDSPAEHAYAEPAIIKEKAVVSLFPADASENVRFTETQKDTAPGKAVEPNAFVTRTNEEIELNAYPARTDESVETGESVIKIYKKRSQVGEILHRVKKNKGAMVGLVIVCLLIVAFICSLFIDYNSVVEGITADRFSTPSWKYPFGTDNMGRNAFLRVIYGTRYSLAIGFGSAIIASIIGVTLGSFAGYYGKITEDIIMRVSDVLASIPGMLLGMCIVTVMGKNLRNLIIAVGITAIPVFIRTSRASILTVREQEFVEASRAVGIPNLRIIFTQVLPNAFSPIIVTLTSNLGMSMIVAASLSFLGFGVPVALPEWGAMISISREYARRAPYLMTFPGLFIMITVLAFNLLGDGLRDALDPKLKGTR